LFAPAASGEIARTVAGRGARSLLLFCRVEKGSGFMNSAKVRVVPVAMALVLSCGRAHAVNVIQNSSFETPALTQNYFAYHTGDNWDNVWFVLDHNSDVGIIRHAPGYPEPYPDGEQVIYVGDSGDRGTVAQPIATQLAAGNYNLSFQQGVLNLNQLAEARIQLRAITGGSGLGTTYGATVYDQLFNVGGPGTGIDKSWHLRTDVINVPTTGFYGLFIIGAQDGLPTLIDDVRLVPEPATLAMAAVGGLLALPRLRRRWR
jgi:hypothetical protein